MTSHWLDDARGEQMPADLVLFKGRWHADADAGTGLTSLRQRRAIPGLIESHTHSIRCGLNGVSSCACGAS